MCSISVWLSIISSFHIDRIFLSIFLSFISSACLVVHGLHSYVLFFYCLPSFLSNFLFFHSRISGSQCRLFPAMGFFTTYLPCTSVCILQNYYLHNLPSFFTDLDFRHHFWYQFLFSSINFLFVISVFLMPHSICTSCNAQPGIFRSYHVTPSSFSFCAYHSLLGSSSTHTLHTHVLDRIGGRSIEFDSFLFSSLLNLKVIFTYFFVLFFHLTFFISSFFIPFHHKTLVHPQLLMSSIFGRFLKKFLVCASFRNHDWTFLTLNLRLFCSFSFFLFTWIVELSPLLAT